MAEARVLHAQALRTDGRFRAVTEERAQAEALARRYRAEFVDLKNFRFSTICCARCRWT